MRIDVAWSEEGPKVPTEGGVPDEGDIAIEDPCDMTWERGGVGTDDTPSGPLSDLQLKKTVH